MLIFAALISIFISGFLFSKFLFLSSIDSNSSASLSNSFNTSVCVFFSSEDFKDIEATITSSFPMVSFELHEVPEIISFMYQDKKNHSGRILCTLLKGIGSAVYDIEINEAEIGEALLHLNLLPNNSN